MTMVTRDVNAEVRPREQGRRHVERSVRLELSWAIRGGGL
jgi:hypothetical protein